MLRETICPWALSATINRGVFISINKACGIPT
jgi:hypothetical protein